MYILRIIYAYVSLLVINGALSDIECDTTITCPENGRCLLRQGLNTTDYVCNCAGLYGTGHNCTVGSTYLNRLVKACYGSNCSTGSYSSENYPAKYSARSSASIFLVYVPGNYRFDLTFDDTFEIELFKDDLYIGYGLDAPFYYPPGDMEERQNFQTRGHFFDGFRRPNDLSITSDTMYIFMSTDNSIAYAGFRVNWTSVAIEVYCPNSPVRLYLPDDSDRLAVTWPLPVVNSGVGYDNLFVTSNYKPGDMLGIGIYTVKYNYEDVFGHSESCSFEVRVEDKTPPVIEECSSSFAAIICNETSVNWTEPMASDNSKKLLDVVFQLNGGQDDMLSVGNNILKYIFVDESGNRAVCEFNIKISVGCLPVTGEDFPTWVVFAAAGAALALLLLIVAIFAYAKLQAVKGGHQADLSFNPEEFTGHKPGAPLDDSTPLTGNGKEKVGMYEIQAYDNGAV